MNIVVVHSYVYPPSRPQATLGVNRPISTVALANIRLLYSPPPTSGRYQMVKSLLDSYVRGIPSLERAC